MPYFYPGKLPWAVRGEDTYTLSYDNEIEGIEGKGKKDLDLIDKVIENVKTVALRRF